MPSDFQKVAGSQATTTARELSQELERFARDLSKTADELRSELEEMAQSKEEINEEIAYTTNEFVTSNLTELDGEEFKTMAEIMQATPEVTTQGLSFLRSKLVEARDTALQQANELMDGRVSAEEFQASVTQAEEAAASASQAQQTAEDEYEAASSVFAEWKDTTVEDDLVELDEKLRSEGKPELNSDNRAYYEPTGVAKFFKAIFGGSSYRSVRNALNEYGHGENGKDAFADISNFKETYSNKQGAVEAAETAYNTASESVSAAQATLGSLNELSSDISTDAQILEKIQAKVNSQLQKTPELIVAMAKHYEEDFPRNLPVLVAKQSTLAKLQEGTQTKLESVQANYQSVTEQFTKLNRLQPHTKIKTDLDQVKKRNQARSNEYNSYRQASSRAWRRARDYDYDYGYRGYNSPSYFETMLMYELLSDNDRHYEQAPEAGEFQAAEDSVYAADLLGVDQEAAEEFGLPEDTFELSETDAAAMEELGFDDYEAGDMSFDLDEATDLEEFFEVEEVATFEPSEPEEDTFSMDSDTEDTSWGSDDDTPSFGGPSNDS